MISLSFCSRSQEGKFNKCPICTLAFFFEWKPIWWKCNHQPFQPLLLSLNRPCLAMGHVSGRFFWLCNFMGYIFWHLFFLDFKYMTYSRNPSKCSTSWDLCPIMSWGLLAPTARGPADLKMTPPHITVLSCTCLLHLPNFWNDCFRAVGRPEPNLQNSQLGGEVLHTEPEDLPNTHLRQGHPQPICHRIFMYAPFHIYNRNEINWCWGVATHAPPHHTHKQTLTRISMWVPTYVDHCFMEFLLLKKVGRIIQAGCPSNWMLRQKALVTPQGFWMVQGRGTYTNICHNTIPCFLKWNIYDPELCLSGQSHACLLWRNSCFIQ